MILSSQVLKQLAYYGDWSEYVQKFHCQMVGTPKIKGWAHQASYCLGGRDPQTAEILFIIFCGEIMWDVVGCSVGEADDLKCYTLTLKGRNLFNNVLQLVTDIMQEHTYKKVMNEAMVNYLGTRAEDDGIDTEIDEEEVPETPQPRGYYTFGIPNRRRFIISSRAIEQDMELEAEEFQSRYPEVDIVEQRRRTRAFIN